MERIEPDAAKLRAARSEVQSFLERKSMWMRVLLYLGAACELGFLVMMLLFMDFQDQTHKFIFFSVLFIYCPLILFVFRNSIRIDHLYFKLVEELKYKE